MYAITNDYFDSFSAIFGPRECLLNDSVTDETKRTCRQVGAHRKEKRKNQAPILKEYSRAYNRLKGRKSRGSISTDKWNRQVAMIQDWRDGALRGEFSDAEFKQRLDEVSRMFRSSGLLPAQQGQPPRLVREMRWVHEVNSCNEPDYVLNLI